MLYERELTEKIIAAAIEVHRYLGPGLLESAYEECLCHELQLRNIPFKRQQPIPILNQHRPQPSGEIGEPAGRAGSSKLPDSAFDLHDGHRGDEQSIGVRSEPISYE